MLLFFPIVAMVQALSIQWTAECMGSVDLKDRLLDIDDMHAFKDILESRQDEDIFTQL